jgi:hypothetical protein
MEAWSLHMLALAALFQHRAAEAEDLAGHALRHFHDAGDIAGITLVLDDLAMTATLKGDPERGGILYGAARHLQQTTGANLAEYGETVGRDFGLRSPRDELAPEDYARLAAQGAAMGLDELIAYALGPLDGEPPADGGPRSADLR